MVAFMLMGIMAVLAFLCFSEAIPKVARGKGQHVSPETRSTRSVQE